MFPATPAPLMQRLQSAINCAEADEPGWISPVMREARDEIKSLRKQVRTLKAKLKAEQLRPKWNGKT